MERPSNTEASPDGNRPETASTEESDAMDEIRGRFVASLPAWRARAEELRSADDVEGLRSQCHRIKGTAGVLGLVDLSASAARCEQALKVAEHVAEVESPFLGILEQISQHTQADHR